MFVVRESEGTEPEKTTWSIKFSLLEGESCISTRFLLTAGCCCKNDVFPDIDDLFEAIFPEIIVGLRPLGLLAGAPAAAVVVVVAAVVVVVVVWAFLLAESADILLNTDRCSSFCTRGEICA